LYNLHRKWSMQLNLKKLQFE
ncbi:hypothetical protein, partial [Plasmodium yoelii yoelii]